MIERTLLAKKVKNFKIFGVPGFPDDIFWAKKVLRTLKIRPKEAVVFTRNSWTKRGFSKN